MFINYTPLKRIVRTSRSESGLIVCQNTVRRTLYDRLLQQQLSILFLLFFDCQVRVFTFLIGREVGDSWQTRWMACSNKGIGLQLVVYSNHR